MAVKRKLREELYRIDGFEVLKNKMNLQNGFPVCLLMFCFVEKLLVTQRP